MEGVLRRPVHLPYAECKIAVVAKHLGHLVAVVFAYAAGVAQKAVVPGRHPREQSRTCGGASVKEKPSDASESRFGVFMAYFPAQPSASPRCWSVMISMIWGCLRAWASWGMHSGKASPESNIEVFIWQ